MSLKSAISLIAEFDKDKSKEVVTQVEASETTITARAWDVKGNGFCPDCGKIMKASTCLGNKVLLCEPCRIVLPMPNNYTPPTVDPGALGVYNYYGTLANPPIDELRR
jgi:hypothetical protein